MPAKRFQVLLKDTFIVRRVVEILAGLLILLFIYTALTKLFDYQNFRIQLSRSPFITGFAPVIAIGLPIVEIIVVGLLFFEKTRIWGFYISFFLMVLFTCYIVAMLKFSYYLPCSCGGVLNSLSWQNHLIFNVLFIIISLCGIVMGGNNKTTSQKLVSA